MMLVMKEKKQFEKWYAEKERAAKAPKKP